MLSVSKIRVFPDVWAGDCRPPDLADLPDFRFFVGEGEAPYVCRRELYRSRNSNALFFVMEGIIDSVDILQIIDGCRQNKRASQHRLYAQFYNYAMTIARRYTGSLEAAEEVINDAFFKVFTKINLYSGEQPFRFWFRRVLINTAIDHMRTKINHPLTAELQPWHDAETDPGIVEDLTREQIIALIDHLPPAYRAVFNLFVVDGYSHEEISDLLNISTGTSKSNLARARQHLKEILSHDFEFTRKI